MTLLLSNGRGLGWRADQPDIRDYTPAHEEITSILDRGTGTRKLTARLQGSLPGSKRPTTRTTSASVPAKVDLRKWCTSIEDQGDLGSCTAHAGVALLEYFERRAAGHHEDGSRLFLYKVTRNLMKESGDTGAYLRTTMKAMVHFGIPPEEYWPYRPSEFDKEPPSFVYAYAQNFKTVKYFRLDPAGSGSAGLLDRIKASIAASMPAMFGFSVYSSIDDADAHGNIPYPGKRERMEGGHAVAAIGYDDSHVIIDNSKAARHKKGALLVRNSWGKGWGEGGYGWLPYEYVERGLADDFWTVVSAEWIDSGEFG